MENKYEVEMLRNQTKFYSERTEREYSKLKVHIEESVKSTEEL